MLGSNSASPSKGGSPAAAGLQASPKPAEQAWVQGSPGSGGSKGAARQGRRRTLPPPAFVESLERLAALHR